MHIYCVCILYNVRIMCTYVIHICIYFNFSLALVITNGPMNVTTCSGNVAEISCDYTGVDPFNTIPDWRIIKRRNDGHVISNETVNATIIRINKTDSLLFRRQVLLDNSVIGNLSVGPVDETHNNTSYQCTFTINDTIIESDTTGTITVLGNFLRVHTCALSYILINYIMYNCTYVLRFK